LRAVCAADKGGHTRVFQQLSELKRQTDAGEPCALASMQPASPRQRATEAERAAGGDVEERAEEDRCDEVYEKVHAELEEAARRAGSAAEARLREWLRAA